RELTAVAELDLDRLGAIDDVVVGQHITVIGNDEARAGTTPTRRIVRPLLARAAGHLEIRAEEAAEVLRHLIHVRATGRRARRTAGTNDRFDVHYTRPHLVDQLGEIRQALHQLRRRRRATCGDRLLVRGRGG